MPEQDGEEKITLGRIVYDWFIENKIERYTFKYAKSYTGRYDISVEIGCSCHGYNGRWLAIILNDEAEARLFPEISIGPYPYRDRFTWIHISAEDPEFFEKLIYELDEIHFHRYGTKAV